MNANVAPNIDRALTKRHEDERKLLAALERQARVEGKIRTFFANRAVKRAERAVLSGQANVLF